MKILKLGRGKKATKLFITHIDLDGAMPIVLYLLQETLDFDLIVTLSYDEITEDIVQDFLEFNEIFIVDMSLPYEVAQRLLSAGISLTILDHHESSYKGDDTTKGLKELSHKNFKYTYDNDKCGTLLFKEYLYANGYLPPSEVIDEVVNLVDTYDRFVTDLVDDTGNSSENPLWEQALSLNRVFYGMRNYNLPSKDIASIQTFIGTMVRRLLTATNFYFDEDEQSIISRAIKRENEITVECLKNMKVRYDERGLKFGVIDLKSKGSIVSRNILLQRTDLEYLIMINSYKDLKLGVRSLRFNVLQLDHIKGHKQAAGSDHEVYTPEFCKNFLLQNTSLPYRREVPQKRR